MRFSKFDVVSVPAAKNAKNSPISSSIVYLLGSNCSPCSKSILLSYRAVMMFFSVS
jgi:hypothetical protein